jgi:pimeloyl-ACP methyl ester carboxylesterase
MKKWCFAALVTIAAVLVPVSARAQGLALAPCTLPGSTVSARCGTFEVFENRHTKAGRRIALRVVVLPATGGQPTPDPIFYFAGGPGGSAVDVFAAAGSSYLASLRKDRDVVLVDQRGTGGSNALRCDLYGDRADMPAFFAQAFPLDRLRACRAELEKHADLTHYSTASAIEDVDDVRAALGYERINLYGGSYGSTAALAYLRQFPKRVRTATLLGVAPPDMKLPLPMARGVDNALARIAADVALDEGAHAEFPDPKADLTAALARLSTPVSVETANPFTGVRQTVTLSRRAFLDLVRIMLYQPESARWLPFVVHAAAAGEFGPFVTVGYQVFRTIEDLIARGEHFCVVCAEGVAYITDAEARAASAGTLYGDTRLAVYRDVCADWPKADVPASFATPVRSDAPVLLIAGEADPVTPPWLAEAAVASLPHGKLVVVPHTGHAFAFPCIDGLVAAFVAKGSVEGLDTGCLASIRRPPFVTSKLLAAAQRPSRTEAPPVAGERRWAGVLDVGAVKLRLVLRVVTTPGGTLAATMDSPDQSAYGLAVDAITMTATTVHFEMRALGATYDGTRPAESGDVTGTWTQGARSWPLVLAPVHE